MNPSNELTAFCRLLEKDKNLRLQVKEANCPQQIIDLAASLGQEISNKELRIWSKELRATYFPWSEKGDEWRRNFFS